MPRPIRRLRPRLPTLLLAALLACAQAARALPPPPPPPRPYPLGKLVADRAGRVLVASGFDGLYRREPGDPQWVKALALPTGSDVDVQDAGDLGWFVQLGPWTSRRGLRTTDGGRHWDEVEYRRFIATGHGRLYSEGADRHLQVSVDRGSSWRDAGRLPGELDVLRATSHSVLYLQTRDHRFHRSEDGGAHWASFRVPLQGLVVLYTGPRGRLYATGDEPMARRDEVQATGLSDGVMGSDDGGRSWRRERFGEPESDRPLDVVFADEHVVVAHEWTQVHRPERLCVRDATRTARWVEPGASFLPLLESHSGVGATFADDGVWITRIVGDHLVSRHAYDRAGLPDPDSGRRLAK